MSFTQISRSNKLHLSFITTVFALLDPSSIPFQAIDATQQQVDDISNQVEDNNKLLKIIFIELGVGQATLVILPNGKSMLVEGGEPDDADTILAKIKENNLTRIDTIISTHPHQDHFGGIAGVIQSIPVGQVLDSGQLDLTSYVFQEYMSAIQEKGIPLKMVRQGETIALDPDVQIDVLNPPSTFPEGMHDESQFNNNSVSIKLTYGEFTALFPGDILMATENRLATLYGSDLDADVLIAPHHGTKGGSTQKFLSLASPDIVVLSPEQGKPIEVAYEKFENIRARLYQTHIDGDITVTSDGSQHYEVRAERLLEVATIPEFDNNGIALALATVVLISGIVLFSQKMKKEFKT